MPRRFLASALVTVLMVFGSVSLALAQEGNYGLDATAGAAGIQTTKGVTVILGDVIGTALSLVSVLFFGLMLYAGIKWMLARGDEGEADKAKDTIIAAIIGLVVVLASYAITKFVFDKVGGGGSTPAPTAENTYCLKLNLANKWSCSSGEKACGNTKMEYPSSAACQKEADAKNEASKVWCKNTKADPCIQVDKNSCAGLAYPDVDSCSKDI